jgi:hypothetical protein
MIVADIHGLSVDIDRVRTAIGGVPRVAYEAAHVYPLSAPRFTPRPGAERERPDGGPQRLYVHIPFCRYACTFCFYAKRINTPRAQMQRYVDALGRELDRLGHETTLRQLYVGGGTPTALPADLLDAALSAISERLPLDAKQGVTRWNARPNRSPPSTSTCAAARHRARQPRRADARRGAAAVDQPPARCPAGARRLRAAAQRVE